MDRTMQPTHDAITEEKTGNEGDQSNRGHAPGYRVQRVAVLLCGNFYLIGIKGPKLLALWQDLRLKRFSRSGEPELTSASQLAGVPLEGIRNLSREFFLSGFIRIFCNV